MKIRILFILISFLTLNSCIFTSDDDAENQIEPGISMMYEPIIMNRTDFENSLQIQNSTAMQNAGKIYLKDHWILLGDHHLGFHIYDNSHPENPVNFKFLKIPGATDLAVKENVIYVNQATDLVAFLFNPQNNSITIYKRIKNAFPPILSPDGYYGDVTENEVVVGWELID